MIATASGGGVIVERHRFYEQIGARTIFRPHAAAESVLFSFSDRPVQQAFGLWREERAS